MPAVKVKTESALRLRPGTVADANACAAICYDAFTSIAQAHNFPPDFPSPDVAVGLMQFMLSNPQVYSVIAEEDGRVVGSNFLTEGGPIAGVGPITVDPGAQNGTVGRRLMLDVLERAKSRGAAGVRLVQAAYHGRSLALYAKLGFEVREPLACVQGSVRDREVAARKVREARETDLGACIALCRAVHGHDRASELAGAIDQKWAMVVENGGRISGYTTMVGFFGHAVGETNDDLKALIGAATEIAGPGLLLPMRNTELFRWSLDQGLRVVQTMTLMSIGLYNDPKGAFWPSVLY
ncbi:MAG: GNAT family N-acetyltransferase [Phycisphaerales bacterium]